MLRNKDTRIISEIKDFFTTREKAIETIVQIVSSLTIRKNLFQIQEKSNTCYSSTTKLLLLLLFPFFEVKDSWHYRTSPLHKFVGCGKDVFYRMLNDFHLAWRTINYRLTLQLIKKTEQKSDTVNQGYRCLIVDDTDFPKTGRRIELIGRVFSHVTHTGILAFKGLFMGYHEGKSFYALDFSLHGEKGKNQKKPYGMTSKESRERYQKKRSKDSQGQVRVCEYAQSKISRMMEMIRLAIVQGIRFDYLLVDSWFTCSELVRFILTRRIGCHLLGMIKAGKTLYGFNGKHLTSSQIVDELRSKRKMKRSKRLSCFYGEAMVEFKGMEVKLFFCKTSHKGKWHGLLTTHTKLSFEEAYKIYSTRWTIEVFFKEAKQHLGLGKCQSQDFDAQIASTTLCMLQYNLLSVAKRFTGYETMGELFRQVQTETLELTLNERIWLIIIEIVTQIAELLETDAELLMRKLVSENEKLSEMLNLNSLRQAG
ncbi:hypothetical protein EZS27_020560 [termite gut metagenome]|uniref:Uncharacterized protein n=1 Tax=termite gut metagenome TaxID=433724 RepID=A0A5J4RDF8_9ZZZZ